MTRNFQRTLLLVAVSTTFIGVGSLAYAADVNETSSLSASDRPSTIPSTIPSVVPSTATSEAQSVTPSEKPSTRPSDSFTEPPSSLPSDVPTQTPSNNPTKTPSKEPTGGPSSLPTDSPSQFPADFPSTQASNHPSSIPSNAPSFVPTEKLSNRPSDDPQFDFDAPLRQFLTALTVFPSSVDSHQPSTDPTQLPSEQPSIQPSAIETDFPSSVESQQPSISITRLPSEQPSVQPSATMTDVPSSVDSQQPSTQESGLPSKQPSTQPSIAITDEPSSVDSHHPSVGPTALPSEQPSIEPSATFSNAPSQQPSASPSLQSKEPSIQPSTLPSSTPSVVPSVVPSTNPSSYEAGESAEVSNQSNAPSASPTTVPSNSNPSTAETNGSPDIFSSAVPTILPSSNSPSLGPTAVFLTGSAGSSNSGAEKLTTQAIPAAAPTTQLYPPTHSGPTPPPLIPLTGSNEHQTNISIALDGIPQLLDPASNLLVEKAITEFLSDEITEMEGVSVFFLRTRVLSQKPFHNEKNSAIVLVEASVHAIVVGGDISDSTFQDQVNMKLKEKNKTFEKHLKNTLDSFSTRVAGDGGHGAMNTGPSSDKDRSGTNMVILVAVISSVMIGIIVLSIGCVAIARKEKEEAREMALMKRNATNFSGHSQPSTASRSMSMKHGSQRQIVTNLSNASRSKSLPRPNGAISPRSRHSHSNLQQCQSMLVQPAGSYYTTSSRRSQSKRSPLECRSLPTSCDSYAKRASQGANHPPRPPGGSVYSRSSSRRGSSNRSVSAQLPPPPPMIQPSYSLSCSSGESEKGLNAPCNSLDNAENIELVEIQADEEGSWVGTKVAAITGGKQSVQKAEMLCKHKPVEMLHKRMPNDCGDSVAGNTTVLNDLALAEATSKTPDSLIAAKTQKSPHRSKAFGLSLFRKNRGKKSEKPSGDKKSIALEPQTTMQQTTTQTTWQDPQPLVEIDHEHPSDIDTCGGHIAGINRQRSVGSGNYRAGTKAVLSKSKSTPEMSADRSQISYPRDRSTGSHRYNSLNLPSNRDPSTSSISNLSEGGYSLSTSGSRSVRSSVSGSSVSTVASDSLVAATYDDGRRRRYPTRSQLRHPMRRRQSTMSSASDPYPMRSRTQSTATRTVISGASSAISESIASDYSSDTSDSERSSLPPTRSRGGGSHHRDDSLLLKLKQTVSTAAYSLAITPDRHRAESASPSGFVRKMTMSGSAANSPNSHRQYSQYSHGNLTPTSSICASDDDVPSRIHFNKGPPLHP